MILCGRCGVNKGYIKRPQTNSVLCRECFIWCFEEEIHWTITTSGLFVHGDKVAIGASGGKDSTVLACIMNILNARYNYGVKFVLLSIDEGISGYRDDSLETVKRNMIQYNMALTILSYKDLYNWSMDEIVKRIGLKQNCTFCGVFRRQALDRGAVLIKANKICTGHNADDIAETVLMNVLRCDVARLQRCTAITTGGGVTPRVKPFKYAFEKEIVMYARARKLDYFSTECKYAPNAYRGHVRALIKDFEKIRPRSIIDIISSAEKMAILGTAKLPQQGICKLCNYISSQPLCQACVLLRSLNEGLPSIGIGENSRMRRKIKFPISTHPVDYVNQDSGTTQPLDKRTSCNPDMCQNYSCANDE